MPSKLQPHRVLDAFATILNVWNDHPGLMMGDVDLAKARTLQAKVLEGRDLVRSAESALAGLIQRSHDDTARLDEMRTRALSLIRGHFGPDSPEYERAGGTRTSERRRLARKAAPAPSLEAVK